MALIHSLYHDQQTKGILEDVELFKFSHDLVESICNFISQIEIIFFGLM